MVELMSPIMIESVPPLESDITGCSHAAPSHQLLWNNANEEHDPISASRVAVAPHRHVAAPFPSSKLESWGYPTPC